MPIERRLESRKIVDQANEFIRERFDAPRDIISLMRMQYGRLFLVTDGLRELKAKKVLDLGCGARPRASGGDQIERRMHDPRMYEAWFARFAAACGAEEVKGVDRRGSSDENYQHIQADLSNPSVLENKELFPDDHFDIVNSSAFLVPSHKVMTHARGLDVTAPELLSEFNDAQLLYIDKQLEKQVLRVLKEGGFFLYNDVIFKKEKGEFMPVSSAELVASVGLPVLATPLEKK